MLRKTDDMIILPVKVNPVTLYCWTFCHRVVTVLWFCYCNLWGTSRCMCVDQTHFNSIWFCQFYSPYTGYLQRAGCSFILSQYITSSASALSQEVNGLNVLPHSYVTVMSIFWDPIELLPVNISGDLYAVHFSWLLFLLLHVGKVKS